MTNDAVAHFDAALTKSERRTIARLTTPPRIQSYLDELAYRTESAYRCPLTTLREGRAHCFDGALFAAAMLRRLGAQPLIVNLFAERDDEHLLAPFRVAGHWGALGKSNFVGLRYREPVYRSLRELVMSYFDDYYNLNGVRTLRSYSAPLNLRTCDHCHWMLSDDSMERVAERLNSMRRRLLLTRAMVRRLSPLDRRSFAAGILGTDLAGVYHPD